MGLGEEWKGGNMSKIPGGGQKMNLLIETIEDLDDCFFCSITLAHWAIFCNVGGFGAETAFGCVRA